jgi:predicted RNase H-like HicB family nuclease
MGNDGKIMGRYTYRIEWSEADQVYLARCPEFPSLAAHGSTPEKAPAEIEFVVSESIRWMVEEEGSVPGLSF